jgi:metal-responsive CopG/Arc/MetJ family transcriptional regulator
VVRRQLGAIVSGKKTMSSVRASISFPPDLYETLEEIAKQKKVSLAWVVRDAVDKYVVSEAKRTVKRKRTSKTHKWQEPEPL